MKKTEPKVNRKNITMKTRAEKNERPEQHQKRPMKQRIFLDKQNRQFLARLRQNARALK